MVYFAFVNLVQVLKINMWKAMDDQPVDNTHLSPRYINYNRIRGQDSLIFPANPFLQNKC